MYAGDVEVEFSEPAAPGLGVADASLVVASLGASQISAGAFEAALAGFGVIRKGADEDVGGFANLADRDQWIFPPEAARFGGPGRDLRSS